MTFTDEAALGYLLQVGPFGSIRIPHKFATPLLVWDFIFLMRDGSNRPRYALTARGKLLRQDMLEAARKVVSPR